ncbi:hypothetical protein PR202_gb28036 [Eleusine coracana subsp. coracana]|uniref:Uncharacterized protein n=1 Tax=Eleusine coracana subsp. coracana TaxID=191504 RepID=A0AAV5FTB5_ELECO|nr:hypothetical protein PR202_gb28036 [Eleusine coracana subsp. coracana]
MTAAAVIDAETSAVVATAADIICSLRGADLAGWTPPWRKPDEAPGAATDPSDADALVVAWPAATRGKRSRSRRGSSPSAGSGSTGTKAKTAEKKARRARGSPPSPLDYSAGPGASTSGGEDGAFCSPPPPVVLSSSAPGSGGGHAAEPVNSKVVGLPVRRSILPVPPPRPAGQRPRKKMRLPEIQQMVCGRCRWRTMPSARKACTALSKENGKLEIRLDQTNKRDEVVISDEKKGKQKHGQRAAEPEAQNGFALPDLNLPAQDG